MRETLSAAVAWLLLYQMLNPLGLQFLQTIVFNLVIAFPIQLLEPAPLPQIMKGITSL